MRHARIVAVLSCAAGALAIGSTVAHSTHDVRAERILYASDWSGTSQIYAVDPATHRRGQLTLGSAPGCRPEIPCGYVDPILAPDGRRLVFSDAVPQGRPASLFVAGADGRDRRRLGQIKPYADPYAVWSPDSRRIVYVATDGIHVATEGGDRRVDHSRYDSDPGWSADSRSLAFVRSPSSNELVVRRGGVERTVAEAPAPLTIEFAWSPRGSWIAYSFDGLEVVHPDGSGHRRLTDSSVSSNFAWSPNGRWLAYSPDSADELDIVHPDANGRRRLLDSAASGLAWSADGRALAFAGERGLEVVDVATGSLRSVGVAQSFAWSPRGRLLAFSGSDGTRLLNSSGETRLISRDQAFALTWSPDASSFAYLSGDLKLADRSGHVRTLVAAAGDYGGSISSLVWTVPPIGVRYRRPARRTLGKVSRDELTALWPIERIAADGSRVAYVACGHVFVWTPAAKQVIQAEPTTSLSPNCGSYSDSSIYSLALAGARVGVGALRFGVVPSWSLGGIVLGRQRSSFSLDEGILVNGDVAIGEVVAGELAGSGDLLVFGSLMEAFPHGSASRIVSSSEVLGAAPGGRPCPTIASSPRTLVPLDVDGGRVVVGADNETWLLDATGSRLLTLPVSPLAAQLSGSDLVILVQGELRDYDASSAALRHAWPLPNVGSGRECGTPNGVTCTGRPRLLLEDAARGLVTYILDGQVHRLRLADGVDTTVGAGTLARFTDEGLVYASGNELRLVPFASLG